MCIRDSVKSVVLTALFFSTRKGMNENMGRDVYKRQVGHSKMYALSKASFIHQLEEQGYKVEWNNDNILFILPNEMCIRDRGIIITQIHGLYTTSKQITVT